MASRYTYEMVKREAEAYKHNYPTIDKYLKKASYYNKLAYNKKLKYMSKLLNEHYFIRTDKYGIYKPVIN